MKEITPTGGRWVVFHNYLYASDGINYYEWIWGHPFPGKPIEGTEMLMRITKEFTPEGNTIYRSVLCDGREYIVAIEGKLTGERTEERVREAFVWTNEMLSGHPDYQLSTTTPLSS